MTCRTLGLALYTGTILLGAFACSGEAIDPTPRPSMIAITPDSTDLLVEESVVLLTEITDQDGSALSGYQISWSSPDASIATVSATGRVTAHAQGVITISAAAASLVGTARVRVIESRPDHILTTIELSAPSDTALPGEMLQITAVLRDQDGEAFSGPQVLWSSSNRALAQVTSTGQVQIQAPGEVGISAGAETITATLFFRGMTPIATAELVPDAVEMAIDGQIQMLERFRDVAGQLIDYRGVAWTSNAPEIAAVSATGMLTGKATGTATVTATTTYEGRQVSSVVTIRSFDFASAGAGADHACALTLTGDAACWGTGSSGRLGNDVILARGPVQVQGDIRFRLIDGGNAHTCGLATDGVPYCWGDNFYGQLRTAASDPFSSFPAPVLGGWHFDSLTVGGNFACGLTAGADVACWGAVGAQLGRGETGGPLGPSSVLGGRTYTDVSAGGGHACAVAVGGMAYCWGLNEYGRLGDGSTAARSEPVPVAGDLTFSSISAGSYHSCGLTPVGKAYCWGYNGDGVLGIGLTPEFAATPQAVEAPGITFTKIVAGGYHTCALASDRSIYCWGLNNAGQVGTEPAGPVSTPRATGHMADALALGTFFTCASDNGTIFCFGSNAAGQLGAGIGASNLANDYTPTPLRVAGQ